MGLLDSRRDLFNFVTTAKHIHQIFQYNRTLVLAVVIKNALPPEILHLAIAARKAADISKSWLAESDAGKLMKQQKDFLDCYLGSRVIVPIARNDQTLLDALYKLWSCLDHFSSLYVTKCSSAARCKLNLRPTASRKLSDMESGRLQRAFLLFELYRRITPAHLSQDNELEPLEQTCDFLKRLHPWQREEILSIEEFLVEVAKDVVRSARDYTRRQISGLAHELATRPGAILEPQPIRQIELFLDLRGVDPFWEDYSANSRSLHYFAARGLPFMRWLSCLSPSNQLDIVIRLATERCEPSILECLHIRYDFVTSDDVKSSKPDRKDMQSGPSYGWKWAESHDLTTNYSKLLFRYELRKMGYCFWDAERLSDHWDCSQPESFVTLLSELKLAPRSRDDDGEGWKDQEPESGLHAMFKGVSIPKDSLNHYDKQLFVDRLEDGRTFDDDKMHPFPAPFSELEAEVFGFEY
jgi:hypothetical protein